MNTPRSLNSAAGKSRRGCIVARTQEAHFRRRWRLAKKEGVKVVVMHTNNYRGVVFTFAQSELFMNAHVLATSTKGP